MNEKINILIVGQTPPPFGGQTVMIEKMIKHNYKFANLFHVRMSFSKEMDEIGLFKFSKIIHLITIIINVWLLKFKNNIKVLYYPPAGPNLIPILRDVIILSCCRPLFKKTIFHFHASGVSEYMQKLPAPIKFFFKFAYNNADMALRLSEFTSEDAKKLSAKNELILPNGIEDSYLSFQTKNKTKNKGITILFVGVVICSKGIEDLLMAVKVLNDLHIIIKLKVVGKLESVQYHKKLLQLCKEMKIADMVDFCGVKTGNEKFNEYFNADIFCFPSFFNSEAFPIVLLEAMCFKLPVVSTFWRGIPSIVRNGETGLLVDVHDIKSLADGLTCLITDENKRKIMGENGRKRFLENYTSEIFYEKMDNMFSSINPPSQKKCRGNKVFSG
jgi:glycosyltransferase involved in cell wall biosynthesis